MPRLGFDTYSLRAFNWKALQLIEYAASQKLDTLQISSLDDYESHDPAHLAKVKDRAAALGIVLDGGMGCICPVSHSWKKADGDPAANILRGLRISKADRGDFDALLHGQQRRPVRRPRQAGHPYREADGEHHRCFKSVRSQAQDLGVKIALENHAGDMQAREVRTIIEEAGKDYVASCLDTGNPMWVAEDPLTSLEVLAPYVVTTHVRDSAVYRTSPRRGRAMGRAGSGQCRFPPLHAALPRAVSDRRHAVGSHYRAPARASSLIWSRTFWKVLPSARAAEFSRFVALAKQGHPFTGYMIVEDG